MGEPDRKFLKKMVERGSKMVREELKFQERIIERKLGNRGGLGDEDV